MEFARVPDGPNGEDAKPFGMKGEGLGRRAKAGINSIRISKVIFQARKHHSHL